jgi:hypothetical protein
MVLTRGLLLFWTLSREAAKGVHILNFKLSKFYFSQFFTEFSDKVYHCFLKYVGFAQWVAKYIKNCRKISKRRKSVEELSQFDICKNLLLYFLTASPA